jgi:hypothetical protein
METLEEATKPVAVGFKFNIGIEGKKLFRKRKYYEQFIS